jgi:hypothetical protein
MIMRQIRHVLLSLVAAAAAWSPAAGAGVQVSFVQPERFYDATLYSAYGAAAREPAMNGIRDYLEHLGRTHLRANETLEIAVLDIDLAGRFEWWRPFAYNTRIVRDITWPRIKVRYALRQDDRVLTSGEESITDLNYLMHATAPNYSDPLRYEKAMLDDWFRARFVTGRQPRS